MVINTRAPECWRTVRESDNYEVSDYGNIRRADTKSRLRPGICGSGYRVFSLRRAKREKRKTLSVHKCVYEAFFGPVPKNMQVNHRDGDKLNNYILNLEAMTPRQNIRHAIESGAFRPRGGTYGNSKLTEEEVLTIKNMLSGSNRHHVIARVFGVTRGAISSIACGKNWGYL